ncbi:MAG: glutaredoxin [Spirochaetales bacterium]|nr:glutaredoxin [Spirochaetales bacterium]
MLQVIGTKKCKETSKALRFLKERGIQFQFVDLNQRALSAGELANIAASVGRDGLIDRDSKRYRDRGLSYMDYDPLEELETDVELLKTPVIRYGKKAVVGFDSAALLSLISGDSHA